ncbi:DNA integrity scanning protein DisA with diadenylate cyclase activity [Dysgonomonas sp. PFB1-18]|uniref:ribosomal maturation YjgA family protein n=1 Tax=unclassified Dysgonomonas TaxID=2630389 RepID=UPI002474FB9F|nr:MULTISPECIES: DUF2809 domain-containing protein [unclassified Dysgonomonas]MDH6308315.1 DNA integrity scanning protein DisA with diadenylate cyclase activity [Dysgonomonas sp. PF1-14]MDH6338247.1 DNA integrity scanning protein DisA with diadenylate cyclase activity [Dysgonomonas sp. PF1-16]MDH6379744.1 DNA integrity scanning protein DisA with diadenylate cyclase activity [Dysgonomonas sp. PFB1-18]MDH6397166.1 DNA integrity scanning protein DisA with diadenylate cyclase activity [Dysgonomonas
MEGLKLRFDLKSFVIFLLIFLVEVFIALFVKDRFIRPYGGDILVVMLMYFFFKSFMQVKPLWLVIGVVVFAYLVEIGQYFQLVEVLGVQDNKVLRTVIGSSFSWGDMVCYTIGGIICYFIDRKKTNKDVATT